MICNLPASNEVAECKNSLDTNATNTEQILVNKSHLVITVVQKFNDKKNFFKIYIFFFI